jgi:hypothetical protein
MTEFESVRVLKTLKFGDKVFQGGKVYHQPLPPEMLQEIARGSPLIEVHEKLDVVEEPQQAQPERPKKTEIPKKSRKLVRRSV